MVTVLRTNLARRPRGGAFLASGSAWGTGGSGVVTRPTGPVSNGPYFSYGDSWSAAATYAQVWPERVQVVSGFSGLVNRGVSGDRMQMAVARMMNGASAWVPGTDGVVTVGALLNNLGSGDTPENRRTALESARAAAAYLSAAVKYEQTDARFAYTGTWSTLTADYCSGGTAAYRAPTITTPGELAPQYVDVSIPAGVNYVSFLGTAVDSTPRGAVWVAVDLASGTEIDRIDSHGAAVPTASGPGGVVRSPVVWRVPGTSARTIRLRLTGPAGYTGDVMGIIDGLLTIDEDPPVVALLKPVEVLHVPYQIPALLAYLRTVPDVVAAEFSNVVPVDPAPGWAPASMLGADLLHPNEAGQEHVAVAVSTALALPHGLGAIDQTTQLTWSTAPTAVPAGTVAYSVLQNQPGVTPGEAYSIEFAASASIPQPMLGAIQWLTAAGASAGVSLGSAVTVGPSGSSLAVVDAVAPAGAATMRADLRLASGASIWSVGDWVRAGELALLDMPGSAFDGFTPEGPARLDGSRLAYDWTGSPNASTSTESLTDAVITAELITSAGSPPPVQIVLNGIPNGAEYVVTGSTGAGSSWPVPGGAGVGTGGQIVLVDNRSALNTPVTYSVLVGGVTYSADPVVVQHDGQAVLQSLDGSISVDFVWLSNSLPREPQINTVAFNVPGRRRPPMRYAPGGDGGGELLIRADRENSAAISALLQSGRPILVRTDGTMRDWPAVELITLVSAPSRLWEAVEGGQLSTQRVWNLSFLFADDPEPSRVLSAWSWDDHDEAALNAFDTWDAWDAMFAGTTWDEWDTVDWGQWL